MQRSTLLCFLSIVTVAVGASISEQIAQRIGNALPAIPVVNEPVNGVRIVPRAVQDESNFVEEIIEGFEEAIGGFAVGSNSSSEESSEESRPPRPPGGPGGPPRPPGGSGERPPRPPPVGPKPPRPDNSTSSNSSAPSNSTRVPRSSARMRRLISEEEADREINAWHEADNRVRAVLNITGSLLGGVQIAFVQAFNSPDPIDAAHNLLNTIVDTYLDAAFDCPTIDLGFSVVENGIDLAGEAITSIRGIIIGS